jgi:nitroimidazol reductase NimA-like FMN-containing flavoprotein (pyridoxamine 5'-phosphate oxidase superfamily)
MDEVAEWKVLELLDQHRIMTVATNRPDGWPQATTVGYVTDGLTLYFLCSPQSQTAANLARDNRNGGAFGSALSPTRPMA